MAFLVCQPINAFQKRGAFFQLARNKKYRGQLVLYLKLFSVDTSSGFSRSNRLACRARFNAVATSQIAMLLSVTKER